METVLYVGNRNYSSWSLRPWLVLSWAKLDFETRVIRLGGPGYGQRKIAEVLAVSPAGTVPALDAGGEIIGDSLAISEWAAEAVPTLWPTDGAARAQARAAVSEMHAGFHAMRSHLPCNLRRRAAPRALDAETAADVARIEQLWCSLRKRFGAGGPYLFGEHRTIADAFFTPVATRFRTYAVTLDADNQRYVDTLLADPDFLAWERDAVAEAWTMPQWDTI